MKKIIAILLSLALLLGCAAGLAETAEKQLFGVIRVNGEFTLKGILADGYSIIPFEMSDDSLISYIISDDPTRPEMVLSIAYDETYSGVQTLNDLNDDELLILEKTFTDTDPYANITYDETAYGTRLMICRTTTEYYDYLDIVSIYNGYFIEFAMFPGKGAAAQQLTDEQVNSCIEFLSELDFVPGVEGSELVTAGQTFDAKITGFDAEAKTIDVTLLTPFTLTEWQLISLKEGETIRIGTEDVEIATLAYGDDSVTINDEYYLSRREDGLFTAALYDMPVMVEAKSMTLDVPDTLVFTEDINPETGEILEEPQTLTAADLFAALAAAQNGDIAAFDSQNVKITFDENGEASQVERYYTPWQ